MSFDHLKRCAACGAKIRPSDVHQACDLCGEVYCSACKYTRMSIMTGPRRMESLVVCPRCAAVNSDRIVGPNTAIID